MSEPAPPRRSTLLILALLFAVVWFGTLDVRKLIRPDEGRYAEIAREMAVSGDWVTPRLNGIKYFEKPPLQYWTTAAAFRVFGANEWTARLWPALTGMLCILLTCYAGRRLYGDSAAFYAAVILAGSPGFIMVGQMNTLDMGLTLFMTATLFCFLLALNDTRHKHSPWMLAAWACAALAVLSKGLIGIVLPGAVLVVYVLIQRDWQVLGRLHWAWGLAVFFAVAAPWFVLVQRANPEFFEFFFVHEHFSRFTTQVHRRSEPWWFFFPVLAFGILPWLLYLPQALINGWRGQASGHGKFQTGRVLVIWSVLIFVFFSVSRSKLPSYTMPIVPALALMMAHALATTTARIVLWNALALAAVATGIMAYAPGLSARASGKVPVELYAQYTPWLLAAGAAGLLLSLAAAWAAYRVKLRAAIVCMGLGMLLTTLLAALGHNALAPSYSAHGLAQQIKPHLAPGTPFYSVRNYDQALPFYIGRVMTLVEFTDEMAFGLQQEPQLWLPDMQRFSAAWHAHPQALAIMEPATYAKLEQDGLPMQIIGKDLRRIVVKKPGAAGTR